MVRRQSDREHDHPPFTELTQVVGRLAGVNETLTCFIPVAVYSVRFGKGRRLGQRHGLQSATLTSYFYKNNY
jgi:hypothetical protein